MSKYDIERIKKEATEHAAEDEKKKQLIEARNQAESLIYTTEKAIKDAGEKLPADIKTSVTEKLETLKRAKDAEDGAAISSAVEALSTEIQKIGQAAYNNQNGSNNADHPGDGGSATNADGSGSNPAA